MPILDLQRRMHELGRIRLGEQVPMSNGKTRPAKLDRFRLTSRDRSLIEAAAKRYGGTVEPWQSPDGDQWQVKTASDELAVIVPPADMAYSAWFELWSAGGCQRRCDGQWDTIADAACSCDPTARECKIHTRLSLMLPDLPGLGLWRVESSGWYAATELAGVVQVLAEMAGAGRLVAARLRLEQRSVKRQVAGKAQTFRFAVPVLDVNATVAALLGGADTPAALPSFTPVPVDELPAPPSQSTAEQVAAVEAPRTGKRRANEQQPLPATGLEPRTAAEANQPPETSDEADGSPSITDPQMRKLRALYRDLGVASEDAKARTAAILGRPVDTHATLTVAEASTVIDQLTADLEAPFNNEGGDE